MASTPIRIKDLPSDATPNIADVLPVDNGATRKTTLADLVNAVAPVASTEEAEAGVDNTKRMTALRVKEALAAQIGDVTGSMAQEDAADYTPTSGLGAVALSNDYDDLTNKPSLGTAAAENVGAFATSAQGSLADTALQPADVGTAAAEDVGFFATAAQGSLADSALQDGSFGIGTTATVPSDLDDTVTYPGTRWFRIGSGMPNGPGFAGMVFQGEGGGNFVQTAYGFLGQIQQRTKLSAGSWTAWGDVSGAGKATTAYVDSAVSGVGQQIAPVRVATTANITLSGTQTIDGVGVIAGNRVLVKNQSTGSQNGVYVVAAGAWPRATDSDTWDEIRSKRVLVQEGTTQAGSGWSNTNVAGGTLGTTAVTYQQSSSGQVYTGASGVNVSGTVVSIDSSTLSTINSALQVAGVGWGAVNASVNVPGNNLDTLRTNGVFRGASSVIGNPYGSTAMFEHIGQESDVAVQVGYGYASDGTQVMYRRLISGVWSSWVNISGAGRAATASNLSDLANKSTANQNLGVTYPTLAKGATGAGGSTDKTALDTLLTDTASELPRLQRWANGSINMAELIPGSDTEPCSDYIKAVWEKAELEAVLRGKAFVFGSQRRWWFGNTRPATKTQGNSSGYFVPPRNATIVWEREWELQDWPLASSPNIIHSCATMGTAKAISHDIVAGSTRTFTVGSGHGFVRGDRVRIIATTGLDNAAGSWSHGKEETGWSTARAEDHFIHSVTSTTVTTFGYAVDNYSLSGATPVMQKYVDEPNERYINPLLRGPGRPVNDSGGGDRAINVVGARNLIMEGGNIEDFGGAWLRLGSIYQFDISSLLCRGTLDSVDGSNPIGRGIFYGGNITHGVFRNVVTEGGGQAFMHSGLGGTDTSWVELGITRGVKHIDCESTGAGAGSFTQHITGEDLEYIRCRANGGPNTSWGFDIRTPGCQIIDCVVEDFPNGAAVAFRNYINGLNIDGLKTSKVLSGIRLTVFGGNDSFVQTPGNITIKNCVIAAGGATSAGAINVTYGVQDGGTFADLGKLIMTNNRVAISSGTTVAVTVAGKWQRPIIDGLSVEGSGTGSSIRVNGAGNGAGNGPFAPVVSRVYRNSNYGPPLIQDTTGTVRSDENYSLS